MRTLVEVIGGSPAEIKDFEISREKKEGILKGRSELFIKTLWHLQNVSKPVTGNVSEEYIALLNGNGSVFLYLRRKPERKGFPHDDINFSVLGQFIGCFNAEAIIKKPCNRKKKIAEWIDRTITLSWMETMKRAIRELDIRI